MSEVVNGVVYLLTSPSGKQYVGQTWDYNRRMRDYRRGHGYGEIGVAIAKHGWNNFTATIIKRGIQTQKELNATETAFIETLGTIWPHGYNLRAGGRGGKHNAKTKAKLREIKLGTTMSPETRKKMSDVKRGNKNRKGKHHTAETKAKIGAKSRGRTPPNKGKPAWNRGKTTSLETRAKISAAKRNPSAETRKKIGDAKRGKSPWNKGKRGVQVPWNKGMRKSTATASLL